MMLTENSTLEDRARYDCPPLQFMRCNDCRPCNDTEKECRSMRKLAARCIDTIGNDTDNVSASSRICFFFILSLIVYMVFYLLIYYPPEVRRGEYWGLGVFLLQYFPRPLDSI